MTTFDGAVAVRSGAADSISVGLLRQALTGASRIVVAPENSSADAVVIVDSAACQARVGFGTGSWLQLIPSGVLPADFATL